MWFLKAIATISWLGATAGCITKGIKALQSDTEYYQGRDARTRYVRDNKAAKSARKAVFAGSAQLSASFMLIVLYAMSSESFNYLTLLTPLPGLLLVVVAVLVQRNNGKDAKRQADANKANALKHYRQDTKDTIAMEKLDTKVRISDKKTDGSEVKAQISIEDGIAIHKEASATTVRIADRATDTAEKISDDAAGTVEHVSGNVKGLACDVADHAQGTFTGIANGYLDTMAITSNPKGALTELAQNLLGGDTDSFIKSSNALGIKGSTIEEIGAESLKSPAMLAQLDGAGLEHTLENVIPFVKKTLEAVGGLQTAKEVKPTLEDVPQIEIREISG